MPALLDREFLFVAGKGGVGRTTTSAAIALAAVRKGKRVLLAMCNTRERLSDLLDAKPITSEISTIAPGFDAVNMVPQLALEEYGTMVLKVRALSRAIFNNRLVSAFLRGTPGIEAWSMLGKAYYHVEEELTPSVKRYDLVIVDGPATGHALDMLKVPRVILEVAPPGLLRREAEKAWSLFSDADRSGVVLVTLPEDMPTNETIELHTTLTEDLHLPVPQLVINGVMPSLFPRDQWEALKRLPGEIDSTSGLMPLAQAGRVRAFREQVQDESRKRLRQELGLPTVELPYLFVPEFKREAIESLSHCFG
jgi:anion-transporting  ArsA/GET3 family ATPase